MTKTEKKEKVNELMQSFKKATSENQLNLLKNQIGVEILQSGFAPHKSGLVTVGYKTWMADLDSYINLKLHGALSQEAAQFTEMSLAGLRNLVDLSELPDE